MGRAHSFAVPENSFNFSVVYSFKGVEVIIVGTGFRNTEESRDVLSAEKLGLYVLALLCEFRGVSALLRHCLPFGG